MTEEKKVGSEVKLYDFLMSSIHHGTEGMLMIWDDDFKKMASDMCNVTHCNKNYRSYIRERYGE